MLKVFFSYSYNDESARLICDSIKSKLPLLDIEFFTPHHLLYGSNKYSSIMNAIEKCDVFVCFVETNSNNVIFELGYAYGMNKQLLLVGDNPNLPFDLKEMNYIPYDIQNSFGLLTYLEKLSIAKNKKRTLSDNFINDVDIQYYINNPELIERLSGSEFELFIANFLRNMGYEVEETSKTQINAGYDLKLNLENGTYAIVEIKKRSKMSKVPLSIIQRFVGWVLMEEANLKAGIVISNSEFTNAAHSYVLQMPKKVLLITIADLINMFRAGERFI